MIYRGGLETFKNTSSHRAFHGPSKTFNHNYEEDRGDGLPLPQSFGGFKEGGGRSVNKNNKGCRGDKLLEEVHTFVREAKSQKDLHEERPINPVIGLR